MNISRFLMQVIQSDALRVIGAVTYAAYEIGKRRMKKLVDAMHERKRIMDSIDIEVRR